jgi:hypothetical protein
MSNDIKHKPVITNEMLDYIRNPGFTKEEKIKEMKRFELMIELGLPLPNAFNSNDSESKDKDKCMYTKDEFMALDCIYNNREIPEDLRQRLLARKKARENKQ